MKIIKTAFDFFDWRSKINSSVGFVPTMGALHDGHLALFEEILKKTGQVCIQVRDVKGIDDNPFDFEYVKSKITERLEPKYKNRFKVVLVPNITNICYGRGVGYKIEEFVLPEAIQKISATEIRKDMRKKGKLK